MRGTPSVAAIALRPLTDNAADTVRGIALVVLAYLMLTFGDVVAKSAVLAAGVGGVMLWRGVFGAAAVLTVAAARPGPAGWRRVMPVRWGWVMARAALAAFVSAAWYNSWRVMALADTYAVGYIAPLLMTVLAVPLLGERIRWRRALSTAVGFAGVLLMLRPGGLPWTPMLALLLAGTVGMAVTRIMTRLLSTTETPECQAFWQLAAHGVAGAALLSVLPGAGAVGPYGVAGAGGARRVVGAGALRIRARLCAGAGVRAGALRIHHAAVGRHRGVRGVRRSARLDHAGRRGGRRRGRSVQLASRNNKPLPRRRERSRARQRARVRVPRPLSHPALMLAALMAA